MKTSWKIVGLALVGAFLFKVYNEREMTKMYERQAVALERLAGIHRPELRQVSSNLIPSETWMPLGMESR